MLFRDNFIQCWIFNIARVRGFIHRYQRGFICLQKFSLVNIKLKWVNDRALDSVVTSHRGLKAAETLVSIISSSECLPIYHLSRYRGQLGLPHDLKLSTFLRCYPNVFIESYIFDSGGSRVPCFSLSFRALQVHQEKVNIFQQNQLEFRDRLCKLLTLTKDRILPLQTIDQLKWDLGLPYDYQHSFVPNHPERFSFVRLSDDRIGLKLLYWDDLLAVSELQKNAAIQQKEDDIRKGSLAFPISFTRGFGLRRKCMDWLNEWQKLPYTSPYLDASHLDRRTDVYEKRIVGVFHELLHLTVHKSTERKNFSNLRMCLGLSQKFTKVFERHPGIFYISKKGNTQTIILKEAYNGSELVQKHPLVLIREELASMLKKGLLDRSRGLYKKDAVADSVEYGGNDLQGQLNQCKTEDEAGFRMSCEYDLKRHLCNDPC